MKGCEYPRFYSKQRKEGGQEWEEGWGREERKKNEKTLSNSALTAAAI